MLVLTFPYVCIFKCGFFCHRIHMLWVSWRGSWNIPHLNGLLNNMETPVIPLMGFIPSLYLHVTQISHFLSWL